MSANSQCQGSPDDQQLCRASSVAQQLLQMLLDSSCVSITACLPCIHQDFKRLLCTALPGELACAGDSLLTQAATQF